MFDYFCYSEPSLDKTDYEIAPDEIDKNKYIKTAENRLFQEIKKENKLIIYSREDKKFYLNGKEIDVKGLKIFPRAFIPYEKELLEALEEHGAESLLTYEDSQKTLSWPKYFQPDHRPVYYTTYKEFGDNYENYSKMMPRLFFKTAKKKYAQADLKAFKVPLGDKTLFVTKPPLFYMNDEDNVMLSPVFDYIEDEENQIYKTEYRAYIVNNKIYSISRSYLEEEGVTAVPEKVFKFVQDKVARIEKSANFAPSYVMDVAECIINDKEVVDVVETNSLACSGLEAGNNLLHPKNNIVPDRVK